MEIKGFSWDWRFLEGWDERYASEVPEEAKNIDLPHTAVTLPYNYFDEREYRKDFQVPKLRRMPFRMSPYASHSQKTCR